MPRIPSFWTLAVLAATSFCVWTGEGVVAAQDASCQSCQGEGEGGACQNCGDGRCRHCGGIGRRGGHACYGADCQGGSVGALGSIGTCLCTHHGYPHCMDGRCRERAYGQPDLFYNYYVAPGCGTQAAQLYMAPHPVPPHVGHVYYTYQPFMPHEFLYPHHRTYHRYYDDGRGLTRTKAHWWSSPIHGLGEGVMHLVKIPR